MRLIGLAVILTLSLVLAPLAAAAQPGTVPRIGVLALVRPRASRSADVARPVGWHRERRCRRAPPGLRPAIHLESDHRGWRATFYTTGMEHSPTSATGTGGGSARHGTRRSAGARGTMTGQRGRLGRPRMTPTLRQCLSHHRSSRYFSRSCSGRSGGSPRRTLTKYRSAASAHTRVTNNANIILSTLPVASRVIGPAVWVMPDARRLGRLFASPGKPDGRQHKSTASLGSGK
jgi:hypothetical protein